MWLEKNPELESKVMSRLNIINFEVLSGGLVNSIYKIAFNDEENYVMKITNNKDENWILEKERSIINNIKCDFYPKLIKFGSIEDLGVHFNIINLFKGCCMDKVKGDISDKIFSELGSTLAKIHKETNGKFGFLYDYKKIGLDPRVHNSYPGPYTNGFDQHYVPAKGWVEHLIEKKSRYSKQLKYIINLMEKDRNLFTKGPITYNHGDYQFKNFIITENGLAGIVDFDSYRLGDPSSDMHMFLQNCFDKNIKKEKIKKFIESYSEHKELPEHFFEKSAFYRYYRSIQEVIAIPFHLRYASENEVKPFKEKINKFLDSIIEGNDPSLNVWREIYGS